MEFKEIFITISFASALAPFVSEVAFRVDTTETSYLNAIVLGIIIGFIVTPLASKMAGFHEDLTYIPWIYWWNFRSCNNLYFEII